MGGERDELLAHRRRPKVLVHTDSRCRNSAHSCRSSLGGGAYRARTSYLPYPCIVLRNSHRARTLVARPGGLSPYPGRVYKWHSSNHGGNTCFRGRTDRRNWATPAHHRNDTHRCQSQVLAWMGMITAFLLAVAVIFLRVGRGLLIGRPRSRATGYNGGRPECDTAK